MKVFGIFSRQRKRFFCLFLLFFPVLNQQGAAESPTSEEVFHRLVEGVERITLSNGLRVLSYKRENAPIFAGQVWVKVGGVNEVPGLTGVSHMLEHMAFKGTPTIGTKDYAKEEPLLERLDKLMYWVQQTQKAGEETSPELLSEVQETIASLQKLWKTDEWTKIYEERGAVGLNAATGKDYTYYMVELPATAFELWCWMESERLVQPVFRQFYQERDVVLEERRMRVNDSPEGKLYEALLATAYWTHPNRLPVIGWASDIQQLQTNNVKELYKTYYRPDNIVIGLVGDLELTKLTPLLERYFGRLQPRVEPIPEVAILEEKQEGPREAVVYYDAEPEMAIAFHKPVYPHPDDMYFWVLHTLLSEGRSSILYKELVQEKQIALSIGSSEAPGELFPSLFYVSGAPSKGITNERLRDEVQKILDRLKTKAVPENELAAARKHVRVAFVEAMASNSGLATALAHSELLWGDWKVMMKMYDLIVSTTAEDIRNLAKRYFLIENRTYVRREKPLEKKETK